MPKGAAGQWAAGWKGPATGRIVVVEDDAGMRTAIERVLQLGGFSATSYSSAEACVGAGLTTPAACLVLDVRLPGMSGFELYSRLLALDPTLPAIFMTAHDDAKTREQARDAGAAAFLAKPFSGRDLLREVRRTVEESRGGGVA